MDDAPDWTPPPRGSALRAALCYPLAALLAFLIAGAVMLMMIFAPAAFQPRRAAWVRAWGKALLWILGVRLEVGGAERRAAPGPAILLFNHASLLDLMVLATQWGEDATVVYKREFHRIPVIGFVMRRLGLIAIDRADRERAVASLQTAAALVQERGAKVFMAPEGTRSRRGGLQQFKLGPFHLAIETGAPLLPVLLRGVERLAPMRGWLIRSGTVRLDYLQPIDAVGWRAEDVRRHADEVRAVFLRYLPAAQERQTEDAAASPTMRNGLPPGTQR